MNGHTNRLATELSPYLRQHATNPVDWYPWGHEAFARAREQHKPVLLSIGYASCHWCHVMAHESFEDPAVAAVMNEHFVNVKVDREERPDVDAVYMSAVQAMTGSGGWPLTVFLTPDGEPFYGGTYFPPTDRGGMPSFGRVLGSLARAWQERRDEVEGSAGELRRYLEGLGRTLGDGAGASAADTDLAVQAVEALVAAEDTAGGFGSAPKFPPHAALRLLLTVDDPAGGAAARRTLDAMAAGGIHDHLGGGFFRYSVDRDWRLPHFEKMLSDNAQLLSAYALAYAGPAGDERERDRYRRVVTGIVAWLERELATTSGTDGADEVAFFSALDADSEGEEGRFYAWTEAELAQAVDTWARDAALHGVTPEHVVSLVARHYGVTAAGTFEGGAVLREARSTTDLARDDGLAEDIVEGAVHGASGALFEHRSTRQRPATDDKVVTSMNGLLMRGLADVGRLMDDRRATELAGRIARFLRRNLWRDGRLLHVWRAGDARVEGLLEDYAYLGLGLLAYYRASFEPWALEWAFELADACAARFADPDGGGYFSTASDAERLLVRPKGQTDGATPAESVAAAELVWWVARYRSDGAAQDAALRGVRPGEEAVKAAPQAFSSAVRLLHAAAMAQREVVMVAAAPAGAAQQGGAALADLVAAFRRYDDGASVVLVVTGPDHPLATLPLLEGRVPRPTDDEGAAAGGARAFVCEGGVCDLPVEDGTALSALLATR